MWGHKKFSAEPDELTDFLLRIMATDAGPKVPRRDSVVSSINSPDETAEVVRGFLNALNAFRSEHGFQSLAELVDRVPKLEADLLEKKKALKLADEISERERVTQEDQLKRNLWLYNGERSRFEEEKKCLEQQTTKLKTSIVDKDKIIAEQKVKEAGLKDAGRKVEEICKTMKAKLKVREDEITQLKQQNQDNHARAEDLAAELKRSQGEISSMEDSLQKMQQRNTQLDASLKEVRTQQEEMASYSAQLQNIDASQL